PAIVGHVQPLVPVGRPRVSALDAGNEMRALRRDTRPDAKRAVDVHPRWMLRGANAIDDVIERVERTGVDVARLQTDDARSLDIGKRVGAHSSLIINGHCDKT